MVESPHAVSVRTPSINELPVAEMIVVVLFVPVKRISR
jgi:hypothetical protein